MAGLRHLFSPVKIGALELENRAVMPGMTLGFGVDDEGCLTRRLTAFYAERAKGRPGMIIASSTMVHPAGRGAPGPRRMFLWSDRVLPGLRELADAVHRHGVKIGLQLTQPGGMDSSGMMVGPSHVPPMAAGRHAASRGMTGEEIGEIARGFGVAAGLCVRAGFDYVEINAAFDYLLSQFLIPYYNRRTDEYGGTLENRARFLLQAVREVREAAGSLVPVGVKVNGDDFLPEAGWTLPDACRLAPIREAAGVSCLHIAGGVVGGRRWFVPSMYEEQGAYLCLAEEVKRHTSLPVMAVVRIKDPAMADDIVRLGKADLVAMGRAHIADPTFIDKARRGQLAEIRPCIAECKGCIGAFDRPGGEVSCTVNPRAGREHAVAEVQGEKAGSPRRVLVAGAGCAGLEAARRAAFAGHNVILCESRGRVGGQLRWAGIMPKRREIADIIPWYERQLHQLGVEIRLNTPVDERLLARIRPDVLVAATGSLPEVPLGFVAGLENINSIQVITVDELLEEQRPAGGHVLVVGSDQIGLQVADHLSESGATVSVAAQERYLAMKMATADRLYLLQRVVQEKDLAIYRGVRQVRILPFDEVRIVDRNGRETRVAVDTVVLASHRVPDAQLAGIAEGMGMEVHCVGDARRVAGEDRATILAAIADGYDVGSRI